MARSVNCDTSGVTESRADGRWGVESSRTVRAEFFDLIVIRVGHVDIASSICGDTSGETESRADGGPRGANMTHE